MATTTDAQERAMIILDSLELTVGDLTEVADEWDDLADGERVSWSIDWSNEMSGLQSLARYAAENALTADQQARYRDLLRRLAGALPIIERLDLYRPPVSLEA